MKKLSPGNISYIKKIVVAAVVLTVANNIVFSQGIDIRSRGSKGLFFGFTLNPANSTITNKEVLSVTDINSAGKSSIAGHLEAGYLFSEYFGISGGIGYKTLSCDISVKSYSISYDTIDADNDNYKRYITGDDITETQKISYLTIPVALHIMIPVNNKFGFMAQTGINLLLNMSSSYNSTGIFTYEGYYSKYNVTVSDIPYEGFETDHTNSATGELKIKSFSSDFFVTGGAYLSLQEKMQVFAGITYCKSLSGLGDYDQPSSYRLSTMPDHLNTLMAGSEKVTSHSFGLSFGIRYFIK